MVQSRCLLKAGTHLLTKLPLPDECQLSHLLPCSHSCLEPIALSIWRGRGWRPGGREELPPGGSEAGAISRSGLGSLGAHRPALHTCLAHGGLAKWPSPRGVLKWQGGREGRTRRRADSVLPLSVLRGTLGALSYVAMWPRALPLMDEKMDQLHGPTPNSQVSCPG